MRRLFHTGVAALAGLLICTCPIGTFAVTSCETTNCVKSILDQVLFSESWRTPDRTSWLAKRETDYKFVTVPPARKSLDGKHLLVDPDLQFRAVDALNNILRKKDFPMFSKTAVKIDDEWHSSLALNTYDHDTIHMKVLEPELFEYFFTWNWSHELEGPIKAYISRGCYYWVRITRDYVLANAKVLIRSTLPDSSVEECIEDALYFALGLVDERHTGRDIAIAVLYHAGVRSGMSRETLFELIDNGSISIPR